MKRAWLLFLALAACTSDPSERELTGETRRFVIDSIAVPKNNAEARDMGMDIDGDHKVDNQAGMLVGTLTTFGDITSHGSDIVASGAIASSVEIVADDFANDDWAGVRYLGADGEDATHVGGTLTDGMFETELGGSATVHLPLFVDADPTVLHLTHVRIALTPDGHGGFDARIAGAIAVDEAKHAAFAGIDQMIKARPLDHFTMLRLLDTSPRDNNLTQNEFDTNEWIDALFAPDLTIDGQKLLSIGFRVHVTPCADGRCTTTQPAATCFDRVHNGDETDIDCGGSCGTCTANATCTVAADCQSSACDGTCAAPTCSDGIRDGFETDVDCGGPCGDCAVGKTCWSDSDCASSMCGAPCTGTFCSDIDQNTCR